MSLDITLYVKVDTGGDQPHFVDLWEGNITHNLGKMADAAGIYYAMWRPEEIGIEYAGDMIEHLEGGLDELKRQPEFYKEFDSPNGWGRYENFVPFIVKYLAACKEHPKAKIHVCR